MPVKRTGGSHVNTASSYLDLLSQLVAFLTTANVVDTPVFDPGNDGDGDFAALPTADDDAPSETITLVCTLAGGAGVATFSVEGSVSGPLSAATSDVPYNDVAQFTLEAGATPWELGDEVEFEVERIMGAAHWDVLKNTTSDFTTDGEVYLRAYGESGTDGIFVNIKAYSSVPSERYNWELQGATAFDTGLAFGEQAGSIPSAQGVPQLLLWANPISFVLVADSRHFALVAFAAGQPTESAFAGWFEAFGPPSSYPAPLFVGGCHWDTTVNSAVTVADTTHVAFFNNFTSTTSQKSNAHVRTPGGSWARLRQGRATTDFDDDENRAYVHPPCFVPTAGRVIHGYGPASAAHYALVQTTLHLHGQVFDDGGRIGDCAIVGQLPGVFWTTGFGLTTGDTLTPSGGDAHFVFNDTNRTGINDYLALALA